MLKKSNHNFWHNHEYVLALDSLCLSWISSQPLQHLAPFCFGGGEKKLAFWTSQVAFWTFFLFTRSMC